MTYPPIPSTVETIGGAVRVVVVTALCDEDGAACWGLWVRSAREIRLAPLTPALQWATLFHELHHVALDDSGLANLLSAKMQEALCDASASARMREQFVGPK